MVIAAEKVFETAIKKYLDAQGCWYVKFFANSFTKKGIPDLLCCINGHFVAIEVKAANGKPSELQEWNVKKIKEAKGIAMVLYPKDFPRFKRMVETLKKSDKDYSRLYDLGMIFERGDLNVR